MRRWQRSRRPQPCRKKSGDLDGAFFVEFGEVATGAATCRWSLTGAMLPGVMPSLTSVAALRQIIGGKRFLPVPVLFWLAIPLFAGVVMYHDQPELAVNLLPAIPQFGDAVQHVYDVVHGNMTALIHSWILHGLQYFETVRSVVDAALANWPHREQLMTSARNYAAAMYRPVNAFLNK